MRGPASSRLGPLGRAAVLLLLTIAATLHPSAAQDGGDSIWDTVYQIGGRPVSLGEIRNVIEQNKPKYGGEIVCAMEDGICCPAYCCDLLTTVKGLNKPMNMSFQASQTAALPGTFTILSRQELREHGTFAAILSKHFDFPVFGGWTLELNFNKPVLDLRSFNAKVVGSADGARTYFLRPMPWNKNIPAGTRSLLVQGLTAPVAEDGVELEAKGSLWYDPGQAAVALSPPPYVPEPRPALAPAPVAGEKYNLGEALQLSILFFEAQRSGPLPPDNRIPWRTASGLADRTEEGKDLTGGWYDAGDHIKLQVPMAYSATILLWGLIRWPDAFEAAGELANMRAGVKWALDYFIKAHHKPNELYVQVADEVDHCYWERPEEMKYKRRAYKVTCQNPGSQPVMNTASALAAGSIAFKEADPKYAKTLLDHAVQLFEFGTNCPGDYIRDGRIPAGGMYNDNGQYGDEHAFAAAWLHKATGEKKYLNLAEEQYFKCCSTQQNVQAPYKLLQWADMSLGVNLLLYEATGWATYAEAITGHLDNWIKTVPRTPKGLSYFAEWAANRFAANAAFTALVAAELLGRTENTNAGWYREYAAQQVYYMLGDNGVQSYLVGFGDKWPTAYHHRGSSCRDRDPESCACSALPNAHTLWGALVGGPTRDDQPSADGCADFIHGEVATDFNAGFTSAVAGLKHLSLKGELPKL